MDINDHWEVFSPILGNCDVEIQAMVIRHGRNIIGCD
jgi:hypothetical protein